MPDDLKHGMDCSHFDAVLADALDGVLGTAEMQAFRAHAGECPDCGPLYATAERGMLALRSLGEVEPPRQLVHNILARTIGAEAPAEAKAAGVEIGLRARVREWMRPVGAAFAQPRFAMSFGMAFFSIALLLNLAGVNPARIDLRPSAIRRTASLQFYETQARVVKYYENIRLVYEVETRFRALKDAANTPQGEEKKDQPERKGGTDSSGEPSPQQNQNYSREQQQTVIAMLTGPGQAFFLTRE
jgi:hypothetical protein